MSDVLGHVFDVGYDDRVWGLIDRDSDPEGEALLELQLETDDDVLVRRFNPEQARTLRLMIAKYERERVK